MKMHKIVVVEQKQVHKVTCNMCGKEIGKNQHGYIDEYITIEKVWSYGSPFDGEKHIIDLCQDCYQTFFNMLKIPPHEKEDDWELL